MARIKQTARASRGGVKSRNPDNMQSTGGKAAPPELKVIAAKSSFRGFLQSLDEEKLRALGDILKDLGKPSKSVQEELAVALKGIDEERYDVNISLISVPEIRNIYGQVTTGKKKQIDLGTRSVPAKVSEQQTTDKSRIPRTHSVCPYNTRGRKRKHEMAKPGQNGEDGGNTEGDDSDEESKFKFGRRR